jgi:hypothetical protein
MTALPVKNLARLKKLALGQRLVFSAIVLYAIMIALIVIPLINER